jgi:hypothetical protein
MTEFTAGMPSRNINNEKEQIAYNKKLTKFFEIKRKWESNKKHAPIKCPFCNQTTTQLNFEISHDLYLADCGKSSCPKMEISRRTFIHFDEKMQKLRQKLEIMKRFFIIEKMDNMFKFIDNKNVMKEFKDKLEEYRELVKLYEDNTIDREDIKQRDQIDDLNAKIYSELQRIKVIEETIMAESKNRNKSIDDIVDIVANKVIPLSNELQNVKYPIMEMNIRKNGEIFLYQKSQLSKFIPL